MRIIFVNRYLPPDQSATAQILGDVADHLSGQGHEIILIGSRMAYDDSSQQFPKSEKTGTLTYHRVATTRLGRASLWKRAVDYVSFYVTATLAVLRLARKGDLVIAKTDPPLLSLPIGLASALKGAVRGNWLQDLYPEVAAELGIRLARGPIGTVLGGLRNHSLRRARLNVVIGSRMADRLLAAGVAPERIKIIANWTDDVSVVPVDPQTNALRREWGFTDDHLVVGYSGNLGRAHDIDTVLEAATQLKDDPNIRFLFIGGGKLRETLQAEMSARALTNIILKPYQPREDLARSLSVADVHWASLVPSLEGLIVPSKIYGVAAAGRPLLFVGDPDGEAGRLIQQHDFGAVIAPGDVDAVVDQLRSWTRDKAARREMGARGRRMIDAYENKAAALRKWDECLETL